MAYRVDIYHKTQKQIVSLPRKTQIAVSEAINHLTDDPRPMGYRKLAGTGLFRVRVGRYRIIYNIDDDSHIVTIVKVAQRREDTYERL